MTCTWSCHLELHFLTEGSSSQHHVKAIHCGACTRGNNERKKELERDENKRAESGWKGRIQAEECHAAGMGKEESRVRYLVYGTER